MSSIHLILQRYSLYLIAALAIPGLSGAALAQNSKTFGDYEVYYSVVNTTFIEPAVASRYGITRGKDKALVNIAVRKQLGKGKSAAQAATISGSSSDLIHSVPLQFTEVREGEAIYYIATLEFRDKELRSFSLEIQPEPDITPYTLEFNKKLYVEQ